MRRALPVLLALICAGCQTAVEAPEGDVDRVEVYQTIADSLPRASFGWGDPPWMVTKSAGVRAEGPLVEPQPLVANEKGFRIHYEVYKPRDQWIPYTALRECSYRWLPVPNAFLVPFLVIPLQGVQTRVVIDTRQVPGLFDAILADVKRLESIYDSWSYAQGVKQTINDGAAIYGDGMLVLEFDYMVTVPPWFPVGGQAEEVARAFAWAGAHPSEPELPDPPAEDETSDEP